MTQECNRTYFDRHFRGLHREFIPFIGTRHAASGDHCRPDLSSTHPIRTLQSSYFQSYRKVSKHVLLEPAALQLGLVV
jgi:hypothetical protein